MYLEHFGLREAPFRITPHTDFFFAGANRGATLDALTYAITHDEGIIKVTGEVGSGKTMLCRMLLEKLPDHVETVYLSTPSLLREDILHAIAEELKSPQPQMRPHQLMRSLQEQLLSIYATNRQVVVLIDEAHAMPAETLEEIRLLSNLESSRHKLLHIVLFGQPELDERLSEKGMRQLKERITHNFALEPLHRDDVGSYLTFRLHAAGYRGPDLFTPGALRLFAKASEGLTRRINILADKALLAAYAENTHRIDVRQARVAARDAQFAPMRGRMMRSRRWRAGGAAVASLAIAAGSLVFLSGTPETVNSTSASGNSNPTRILRAEHTTGETISEHAKNDPAPPSDKPTLAGRIAATEEWLKTASDTHYFIQLLSTDGNNQRDVEAFIENHATMLDPGPVRVYRSSLSGRDRMGVIYGDFPSREAAKAELDRLAGISPVSRPYLRRVSRLK